MSENATTGLSLSQPLELRRIGMLRENPREERLATDGEIFQQENIVVLEEYTDKSCYYCQLYDRAAIYFLFHRPYFLNHRA
jgi:hypothetical protein